MSAPRIRIATVESAGGFLLKISLSDGRRGVFDVSPYLGSNFFAALRTPDYFAKVRPVFGGGGIAWPEGQDLSADTVEAELQTARQTKPVSARNRAAPRALFPPKKRTY